MKWAVFLGILASLFVGPTPVYAAGDVVYIDATVGMQTANLKKGAALVDRYTRTRFVYGKCRTESRCIRVRIDTGRVKGTGWSSWSGSERKTVRIDVNPGRGSAYMSRLWAHEVAHAMFVGHSRYASNLMWPDLYTKSGKLVAWRFTSAQITTLRKH